MRKTFRLIGFGLALGASVVSAEIVSGKVTDLATKGPLAGVLVASGRAQTLSAADGSYSLNTDAVTSVWSERNLPAIRWDMTSGSFRWDAVHGDVVIEVRDILGNLLDRSRQSGTSYRFQHGSNGLHVVTVHSAQGFYRFRMNRIGNMAVLLSAEQAPGRSAIRALVKVAALPKVIFTMAGYDVYAQNADGVMKPLDVALHKTGSLTWRKARQTWYESYPDPGSDECVKYSGCKYSGQFSAIGKKDEQWVMEHNLVAVHERDFNQYKLKTLRLKYKDYLIDALVVDECSDGDCGGCCSKNAASTGFLIDLEINGTKRFGLDDGTVEWTCIDC